MLTAADVGKPVDLYEKKPMDSVRDVTMNMPKTKVSFMPTCLLVVALLDV